MKIDLNDVTKDMRQMTIGEYIELQKEKEEPVTETKNDTTYYFENALPQINVGDVYIAFDKNFINYKIVRVNFICKELATIEYFNLVMFQNNLNSTHIKLSKGCNSVRINYFLVNYFFKINKSVYNKLNELYSETKNKLYWNDTLDKDFLFEAHNEVKPINILNIDSNSYDKSMTFEELFKVLGKEINVNKTKNIETFNKLINKLNKERFVYCNNKFVEVNNSTLNNNDGKVPYIIANTIHYNKICNEIEFIIDDIIYLHSVRKLYNKDGLQTTFKFNSSLKEILLNEELMDAIKIVDYSYSSKINLLTK